MYLHLRIATELWHRLIVVVAGALAVAWCPGVLVTRDGGARRAGIAVVWAVAIAYVALGVATVVLNDDETYYLAEGWSALRGAPNGDLPMRHMVFWPFLVMPLSAASTVMAGRVFIAAAGIGCAVIVRRVGGALQCGPAASALAGALVLVWLRGEADWSFLRPEYFATLFLMGGLWFLIAPPSGWARSRSTTVAFALFGLMALGSHRHVAVAPGAVLALLLETPREERWRALGAVVCGVALSLIPTGLYLLTVGSVSKIVTLHVALATSMKAGMLRPYYVGAVLPLWCVVCGLASVVALWGRRKTTPGAGAAVVMWVTCLGAALLNPIKLPYALSSFVCVSALVTAGGMSAVLQAGEPLGRRVLGGAFTAVLLLTLLHHDRGLVLPPGETTRRVADLRAQLRLVDWLEETAGGEPVLCVTPYHPLRVPNGWRLHNAHYYCYVSRTMGRELEPALEETLLSGKPAIIHWDPWPEYSEKGNLLEWAVGRGFVAPARVEELRRVLREHYRLVRWPEPLPKPFGAGQFLVRRDRPFAGAVEVADGLK